VTNLNDLRVPPGNRLEELSGNRQGQHSIRVNDQYRICFEGISTRLTALRFATIISFRNAIG
ncbi:MAG: type II toxin-antitoxin system RelE/ParE family toxin, partial [Deinococcota bacterium]